MTFQISLNTSERIKKYVICRQNVNTTVPSKLLNETLNGDLDAFMEVNVDIVVVDVVDSVFVIDVVVVFVVVTVVVVGVVAVVVVVVLVAGYYNGK